MTGNNYTDNHADALWRTCEKVYTDGVHSGYRITLENSSVFVADLGSDHLALGMIDEFIAAGGTIIDNGA